MYRRQLPPRRRAQLGYLGIATRRALGGGSSNALIPTLSFDFSQGTAVSTRGNVVPSFTRATTKVGVDWEGNPFLALSGEVVINGLRRVQNRASFSQALDNAAWGKLFAGAGTVPVVTADFAIAPDGTQTADRLQCALNGGATGADESWISRNGMVVAGIAQNFSVWMKSNTGGNFTIHFGDAPRVAVIVTPQWQRFSTGAGTASSGATVLGLRGNQATSDSCDILVWGMQMEDMRGQSNTSVGEYVSTNVLASPFYGLFADGVQQFPYLNGNTVAGNVVTAASGAGIPKRAGVSGNWPNGYFPEVQNTNLVLQSENFGTTWAAIGTPSRVAGNVKCGFIALDQLTDADAGTLDGYSQVVTFTGNAVKAISCFVAQGTSTSSVIRVRDTTGAADRLLATITWVGGVPTVTMTTGTLIRAELYVNSVYRIQMLTTAVTAANVNQIEVYPATNAALAVANTGNLNVGGVMAEDATTRCSSYLPTTTTTVTRNKDDFKIAALGAWFNPAVWTFVVQYQWNVGITGVLLDISDGTGNSRGQLYSSGGASTWVVTDATVNQAVLTGGSPAAFALGTFAAIAAANDYLIAEKGVNGTSDSAGTMPVVSQLEVGQNLGANQFCGLITSMDYYGSRPANGDFARLAA